MRRIFIKILALTFLLTFISNASAQLIFPGSIDPGRAAEEATASATAPKAEPTGPVAPKKAPTALIPGAEKIKFKLTKFVIEGNTVFSTEHLLKLFRPGLNREVSLADIQRFATAITNQYRNAGYVLSRAILPPQTIRGGVVKILVIEGYISKIEVKGDVSKHAKEVIYQYGEQMAKEKPVQIKDVERYALLANDLPGVTVKVILIPSKTESGASDLILTVSQDNFYTYTTYDNRGTLFLGPERLSPTVYFNSFAGMGAVTSSRYLFTPGNDSLKFFQISHEQFFGTNGNRLRFNFEYSRTFPLFTLSGTNTLGRAQLYSMTYVVPIVRSRSTNIFFESTFRILNSGLSTFDILLYLDHIRTLSVGFVFNFFDDLRGSNSIALRYKRGLDIFGANNANDPVSRIGARPNFNVATLYVSRLQYLGGPFSLWMAAFGQYGFETLYASEQIGYGGVPFGQAYDPSEILGDRGVEAVAELRYTPPLKQMQLFQLFVFYDGGVVWNIDHINQLFKASGTSAGAGVRIEFGNHISFGLEAAKPLTLPVLTQLLEDPTSSGKAWRFFYYATVDF